MAKDGRKLELYEILAAKRAKGKIPTAFDAKPVQQANSFPGETADRMPDAAAEGPGPNVIVDDAVAAEVFGGRAEPDAPAQRREAQPRARREEPKYEEPPEPRPEPKPRTTREVVFALDTAFIFFVVVLALVGSSYFLGYKRGQEERPTGLAGLGDVEVSDPDRLGLRNLEPAPRSAVKPSEHDYTLLLRTEPVSDDLPERLELELAEAVSRGRQETGGEVNGFIFRTGGANPRYVLAVGLGRNANDPELNRLLQVYNRMEGITLSRESRPYIGCRIAPVRELGTSVY